MKSVAETILEQLGGNSRVALMAGVTTFLTGSNCLSFKFKGSRVANYVSIKLEADDTYTVEFVKTGKLNFKSIKKVSGIYADGLIELFENTTGLALRL
jgi:hypothetical protein